MVTGETDMWWLVSTLLEMDNGPRVVLRVDGLATSKHNDSI